MPRALLAGKLVVPVAAACLLTSEAWAVDPNPRKPGAGTVHLYCSFPGSGACVRLKELDGLLGHLGRWTGVPPPQERCGGPMRTLLDIRYEGINPRDPGVHLSALTVDVRPR